MRQNTKANLGQNEQGIVAIIVSMIVLLMISLMTLGFARIMQREQRQAVDRQLSTQAFYAAESGINDALRALKLAGAKQIEKTDCKPNTTVPKSTALSGEAGVGSVDYTCLLIESGLPDLRYEGLTPGNGRQYIIQTATGGNVDKISIEWDRNTTHNDFSAGRSFPSLIDWPSLRPDALRVTVFTRASVGGVYSGEFGFKNFILMPSIAAPGAGSGNFSLNSIDGEIVEAHCQQPNGSAGREYACKAEILGVFATPERDTTSDKQGGTVVGIIPLYKSESTDIRIQGLVTSGGTSDPVILTKSQYRIDVTGKASDVYRRLQVRVSQGGTTAKYKPDRAIQISGDLCKRFMTEPSSTVGSTDGLFEEAGGKSCTPN